MITGLIKVRGEVYITGRHTIEVLANVGGNGFPFAVVDGATIPYGCVSPSAKCPFAESFASVGSARNEALGVDRKSTRLNFSPQCASRMPSSAFKNIIEHS